MGNFSPSNTQRKKLRCRLLVFAPWDRKLDFVKRLLCLFSLHLASHVSQRLLKIWGSGEAITAPLSNPERFVFGNTMRQGGQRWRQTAGPRAWQCWQFVNHTFGMINFSQHPERNKIPTSPAQLQAKGTRKETPMSNKKAHMIAAHREKIFLNEPAPLLQHLQFRREGVVEVRREVHLPLQALRRAGQRIMLASI